jgi:transcriptional regulator with XRE-family HTH domain
MNNTLGEFIKSIREERNISVRALAKVIGISHNYLNNIEKGYDPRTKKEIIPSIETLEVISKGLGLQLSDLLHLTGYIKDGTKSVDEAFDENIKNEIRELAAKLDLKEIRAVSDIAQQGYSFVDLKEALESLLRKKIV